VNIRTLKKVNIRTMDENKYQSLPEYLHHVMNEKGLDGQDIENRARRRGHKIDRTYISRIISGTHSNPTIKKIAALAAGLDVDPAEVFAAALGIKAIDDPRFRESLYGRLWEMAKNLPEQKRESLERAMEIFIRGLETGIFKPDDEMERGNNK
jgi:transcriptional regulator with XRE-family HTH domain